MSEEWVSLYEDYPQIEKGYTNVSVTVIAKTDIGAIFKAFYGFHQKKWYTMDGYPVRKKMGEVIAWKSL